MDQPNQLELSTTGNNWQNSNMIIFEVPPYRNGTLMQSEQDKIKFHSLNQINERNERIHNQEIFAIKEENRKQNLALITKKIELTTRILLTIINTIFQSLISLIAALLYVVNTYIKNENNKYFELGEVVIALIFMADYLFSLIRAINSGYVKTFFFKPSNLFDLVTITPALISFFPYGQSSLGNFLKKFIGIVRVLRVFRVFRIFKLIKEQSNENQALREYWELKRKSYIILFTLFLSIFVISCLIYEFTNMDWGFQINDKPLSFDEALYYITVTSSTVGYGDYVPSNNLTQLFTLMFIITIIFLVTKMTSEFNDLQKNLCEYKLPYIGQKMKHILLIGQINTTNLIKFTKEFYHPDNQHNNDTPLLIMMPEEPNEELAMLMKTPQFQHKIFYVVGNALKQSDLNLASLTDNKVVILANQFSQNYDQEDMFAMTATQIIKELYPLSQIYAQIGKPENQFWSFWHGWECVCSVIHLKMSIINKNTYIPGFSTLISNLIMSFSQDNQLKNTHQWQQEYVNGMGNEIYLIQFSDDINNYYVGQNFQKACQLIYQSSGITLIGVKVKNIIGVKFDYYDTLLNPQDYYITKDDIGIVIAKDVIECNELFQIKEHFENHDIQYKPIKGIMKQKRQQELTQEILYEQYFNTSTEKGDLRSKVKNHILVFGDIKYIDQLISALRVTNDNFIFYVSKHHPSNEWNSIKEKFRKVAYIECEYFDINELEKTSIQNAFFIIILGNMNGNEFQDSQILPLSTIIKENFPEVQFTIEMTNEKNVKYLEYLNEDSHIKKSSKSPYIYDMYASSKLFYSASLDYIMGKACHEGEIIDIILKIVSPNCIPNHSKIKENYQMSTIKIPDDFDFNINYLQLFNYFTCLKVPLIPIALYRTKHAFDNFEPYVYTNPIGLSPIMRGDIIILIGVPDESEVQSSENLLRSKRRTAIKYDKFAEGSIELSKNKNSYQNLKQMVQDTLEINQNFLINDQKKQQQIFSEMNLYTYQFLQIKNQTELLSQMFNQSNAIEDMFGADEI